MMFSSQMSPEPMTLAIVPPISEPADAQPERPQQADLLAAGQQEAGEEADDEAGYEESDHVPHSSLRGVKLAGQIGVIALVALAITVLPGGGTAVEVVLTALTLAFLTAIAFGGYRLFHQFRFELESLEDRDRAVLYGSIALTIFAFAAARADVRAGGGGIIAWFALIGIAVYGLYWVWTRYRQLA